jgi:hypothetical protein
MKIWLISFVVLLLAVEASQGAYQWIAKLALPLPVLLLASAVLAIGSNARQLLPTSAKPSLKPDQ